MASNDISLHKFFLILQAHISLVVGIVASAVVIAGVITYLTPKMYTATASLNFEFSANPVDSRAGSVFVENTYLTTQIGIIKSQHVAQEVENGLTEYERNRLIAAFDAKNSVINQVKYAIKKPIQSLFKGGKHPVQPASDGERLQISSAYSWLARAIGYDLSVQPMFNSRIVEISYSSTDQQIAALMANRIAEAYIDTNLKMMINPAHKSKLWFDEQIKSLRKSLESAQSKLTAYQQQEGIVFSDERLDTETSRLNNLSGQFGAAQQKTRNTVTEQQKLNEILQSGASLMTFRPVFDNTVIQRLVSEIRKLEGELVEMSGSLGANHPKMKKVRSELSAARQRLNADIQVITDGVNNTAELARERERDLQQALEEQKQVVLNLKYEHDRIAVLKREVESVQGAYNAALNQLNTTSMQSMVDQTNVSIVDPANIPKNHSSPRVLKNLVLGLLGGALLGIGLAIFMEIFIRRVHSKEDLIVEVGLPLLGHLKKV